MVLQANKTRRIPFSNVQPAYKPSYIFGEKFLTPVRSLTRRLFTSDNANADRKQTYIFIQSDARTNDSTIRDAE